MTKWKKHLKKAWWFIWEDDSMLSWVVNIGLAFIVIKFLVYPGLGLVFGTNFPVVAVVSGSMEHKMVHPCINANANEGCTLRDTDSYEICGKRFSSSSRLNLDDYWDICGDWYEQNNIMEDEFKTFIFKNGFNTGDIIVLFGANIEDVKIGDVIVFASNEPYPIIHRIVTKVNGTVETKGDHNSRKGLSDLGITNDRIIGKAAFRIPYLGWIKIVFFKIISPILKLIG